MADPGLYVRRFPWAAVVVAMGVGYLLVPKRKEKEAVYPNPDQLAKLIKQNRVRVETNASEGGPRGLIKNLLAMGVMAGARGGLNYIVQRFTLPSQSSIPAAAVAPSFVESSKQSA
jgi:hypothetical protein